MGSNQAEWRKLTGGGSPIQRATPLEFPRLNSLPPPRSLLLTSARAPWLTRISWASWRGHVKWHVPSQQMWMIQSYRRWDSACVTVNERLAPPQRTLPLPQPSLRLPPWCTILSRQILCSPWTVDWDEEHLMSLHTHGAKTHANCLTSNLPLPQPSAKRATMVSKP